MKNSVIIALALGCLALLLLWQKNKQEVSRLSYNQEGLLDSIELYTTRDSLSAASLNVLTLKLEEMREYRRADLQTIKNLNLRLRRVQSISTLSTASSYRVQSVRMDSTKEWHFRSAWMSLTARSTKDTLHTSVVVYDTLVQVLHRVPRFKFLGIWFGTKGVRQEIVSKNPHTRIVAAEYIEIEP